MNFPQTPIPLFAGLGAGAVERQASSHCDPDYSVTLGIASPWSPRKKAAERQRRFDGEHGVMEILVIRHAAIDDATIGTMTIGNKFKCFTLEDIVRDKKIKGKTAIPAGSYPLTLSESPRFSDSYEKRGLGRVVPLLEQVPGFVGVRIHIGNVPEHTHGCILVGDVWDRKSPRIGGSTAAFKRLMGVLGAETEALRVVIRDEMAQVQDKLRHPSKTLFDMMRGATETRLA